MKYAALGVLTAMALVLLVGAWLGMREVRPLHRQDPMAQRNALQAETEAANRKQALAGEIARTRKLADSLKTVADRAFATRPSAGVIAHADTAAQEPAAAASRNREMLASQASAHVVTLLYSGDGFKRAVVDGKYVAVGDRLSGGARVVGISDSGVIVAGSRGRTQLKVPSARRAVTSPN